MEKSKKDEGAFLIAQAGLLDGSRWAITQVLVIGRDEACDIILTDRQVSRRHAQFLATEDGVLIEDLGSKNGTLINGQLIFEPTLLKDGDMVQIAMAQKFFFISSDSTIPLEPSQSDFNQVRDEQPSGTGKEPITRPPGRLRIDRKAHRVWIRLQNPANHQMEDHEILPSLSAAQYTILELLYDQQGKVVPRRDIITAVWGISQAIEVSEQALDALVRRLRDRLTEIDPEIDYIVTVRGHGIRLDNPPLR